MPCLQGSCLAAQTDPTLPRLAENEPEQPAERITHTLRAQAVVAPLSRPAASRPISRSCSTLVGSADPPAGGRDGRGTCVVSFERGPECRDAATPARPDGAFQRLKPLCRRCTAAAPRRRAACELGLRQASGGNKMLAGPDASLPSRKRAASRGWNSRGTARPAGQEGEQQGVTRRVGRACASGRRHRASREGERAPCRHCGALPGRLRAGLWA